MKYYSEILKKCFESEAECKEAEDVELTRLEEEKKQHELEIAEKKARAAEVEDAYKEYQATREHYNELVTAFIKDYKSYHFTFSNTKDFLNDIFDTHFKFF